VDDDAGGVDDAAQSRRCARLERTADRIDRSDLVEGPARDPQAIEVCDDCLFHARAAEPLDEPGKRRA
jgi:hypothetical protein